MRPDGRHRAGRRDTDADLHDGELAPVHGQPVPGLAPQADRGVQRLPRGSGPHGDQGRHRASWPRPGARWWCFRRGSSRGRTTGLPRSTRGPRFIARSAAKQRAKAEPTARTLIVPVALRYRFLGRLEESVTPVLDRIETRLTWTPGRSGRSSSDCRHIGNAILGLKEIELVGGAVQGAIHERLARLIDDILGPLEAEWAVKKRESDVPSRVRGLRAAILPDLVEGGVTDDERDRRWRQLALLYLAQQLSLYPAGYLEGSPSPERVLETVERLEEDLTDVATVHRPLAVTIRVGEPIEVGAGDASPAALMKEVRTRLEALLGIEAGTHPGRDRLRAGGVMNGEPSEHAALDRAGTSDRASRRRGGGGAGPVVLDPVAHRGAGIPGGLRLGRSAPAHGRPQSWLAAVPSRAATRC